MRNLKLFISFFIVFILGFYLSLPCFGNDTTYVYHNKMMNLKMIIIIQL